MKAVFTIAGAQTFVVPDGVTQVELLVVGGGGGGAQAGSGGGGGSGGEVLYWPSVPVTPGASINVIVGTGGAGRTGTTGSGTIGGASSFNTTYSARAGGGGAGGAGARPTGGAFGGGGQGSTTPGVGSTGTAAFKGGDGANYNIDVTSAACGGGGGAGGAGGNAVATATTTYGGNGGIGVDYSSIFGTDVGDAGWFGGGGGGGVQYTTADARAGLGGRGGGGVGAASGGLDIGAAKQNTGGGGGGGAGSLPGPTTNGGAGSRGVVIVQWTPPPAHPNTPTVVGTAKGVGYAGEGSIVVTPPPGGKSYIALAWPGEHHSLTVPFGWDRKHYWTDDTAEAPLNLYYTEVETPGKDWIFADYGDPEQWGWDARVTVFVIAFDRKLTNNWTEFFALTNTLTTSSFSGADGALVLSIMAHIGDTNASLNYPGNWWTPVESNVVGPDNASGVGGPSALWWALGVASRVPYLGATPAAVWTRSGLPPTSWGSCAVTFALFGEALTPVEEVGTPYWWDGAVLRELDYVAHSDGTALRVPTTFWDGGEETPLTL